MRWRHAALVVVTAGATIATGWLSRAPYDPPGSDTGLLRLSWRLRGEKIESCRPRTPAELEALPVHMRTPGLCVSRLLAYRLTVQLDDHAPVSERIVPGGARADRPIYVFRELPMPPGAHRVRVTFAREDSTHAAATPLVIDKVVNSAPGIVELITLDAGAARFVLRSGRPSVP